MSIKRRSTSGVKSLEIDFQHMANDIPQLQNGNQARLLATQRRLYRWAKTISAIQIVLVIVPPTLLLVIDHLNPTLSVWPHLLASLSQFSTPPH